MVFMSLVTWFSCPPVGKATRLAHASTLDEVYFLEKARSDV